jgi:hypothetical protein
MAGEHQPDVKLFGKWGFDDVEVRLRRSRSAGG